MKRPVRTKERYILDSLLSIFKGGEWVEPQPVSEIAPAENYEQPLYLTVIGGQKYDKAATDDFIGNCPYPQAVVGEGRGIESDIAKSGGESVTVIPVNPDLYGKSARKVNVEQVLSFAPDSPLLLVGNGERVKAARAWLKRYDGKGYGRREVIELP